MPGQAWRVFCWVGGQEHDLMMLVAHALPFSVSVLAGTVLRIVQVQTGLYLAATWFTVKIRLMPAWHAVSVVCVVCTEHGRTCGLPGLTLSVCGSGGGDGTPEGFSCLSAWACYCCISHGRLMTGGPGASYAVSNEQMV